MWRRNAILLFGLLLWGEPASAQKVYPLTVSIHEGVIPYPNQNDIEKILKAASDLLQKTPNSCPVGFKLDGIKTFNNAPAIVRNQGDLEAVHSVPAQVKIVQAIHYCVGHSGEFSGCSWRLKGQRTVIVIPPNTDGIGPMLWAHEFGHTTGLQHRNDKDNFALMTPCPIGPSNQKINKDECSHFRAGPVPPPYPPGLGDVCPPNPSRRHQTD
jgi:hypothetical protein